MLDHFPGPRPARPPAHRLLREALAAAIPMPRHVALAARRNLPRGDGHPVLVVPSFLRSDGYMLPLRRFLTDAGYAVYGWRLGVNLGPTDRILKGLDERLAEIGAREGRTVSLIGHSLGGAMARELAKQRPQDVRLVITLSSPIRLPTASPLEPVYRMLSRWHSAAVPTLYAAFNEPPSVPVTAIHTRSDGIVAWQSCLETEGPSRENLEIAGAHSTMARNPAAWRVIADRLAQPEGTWRPYLRRSDDQNRAS